MHTSSNCGRRRTRCRVARCTRPRDRAGAWRRPIAQCSGSGVERVVAFADVHGAYAELTGTAARGRHHRRPGPLVGRPHARREPRRPARPRCRLAQGHGPADAAAGRGQRCGRPAARRARQPRGDERARRPALRRRRRIRRVPDMEPAEVRARRMRAWQAANGPESGAAFEQRFPPGYFGHRAALAPDGRYGQWLLALPVAIVNQRHAVHARRAFAESCRACRLPEVNLRYRTALDEYLDCVNGLEQAGLLQAGDAFRARPRLAAERLARWRPAARHRRRAELVDGRRALPAGGRNRCSVRTDPTGIAARRSATRCSEADVLDARAAAVRRRAPRRRPHRRRATRAW